MALVMVDVLIASDAHLRASAERSDVLSQRLAAASRRLAAAGDEARGLVALCGGREAVATPAVAAPTEAEEPSAAGASAATGAVQSSDVASPALASELAREIKALEAVLLDLSVSGGGGGGQALAGWQVQARTAKTEAALDGLKVI